MLHRQGHAPFGSKFLKCQQPLEIWKHRQRVSNSEHVLVPTIAHTLACVADNIPAGQVTKLDSMCTIGTRLERKGEHIQELTYEEQFAKYAASSQKKPCQVGHE